MTSPTTRTETTRPTLFLLHGWGMNPGIWQPLLEPLAAQFDLTLGMLPGHGEQPPATRADLAEWARLCLDQAPEQAIWLGWSLGGLVGLRAALDAPERVERLICVAASPCFTRRPDWPAAMRPELLAQFADSLGADHQATLERFLALQVHGSSKARELLRQLRESLAKAPPPHPRALAQGLSLLAESDLRGELAALRMPVDWLFGQRDALVPRDAASTLQSLSDNSHCILLSGATHAPFLSHPTEFLDLLEQITRVGLPVP